MGLMLNPRERARLAEAASEEKRVRNWRRMRAIELLVEGRRPEAVALRRSDVLAPAFMRGPRRGGRWGFGGFVRGRVPVGGVHWRGEPKHFWKNS